MVDFEIGWHERPEIGRITPRRVLIAPSKVVEGADIEVVRPTAIHLPAFDYVFSFVTHAFEIRKQIREFQPNIVVGLGLLNAFAGIRLARRARIPFVYYLIDELHRLVPQQAFQGLARVVEQANVRSASLVLSINQALREYTVEMGAPPDRAKVLPAGVDLPRYLKSEGGPAIRERLGLATTDLVLFFMGWVYPFSGLREVAESLSAGEGRDASVKLLVVGKGDSWDELARLAKSREAGDRIKLVGFQPYAEVPPYLAAADVCLLPAQATETMLNIVPIKMYEYLAAGKPVIATRLPGLVKEFGEGHGVVYVDSPEGVVSKAVDLAREGSLESIGRAGRDFVSGNDWNSITDTFERYLKDLADHPA